MCPGGGSLDAPGRWPSQAAVAAEMVALPYATHFQLESAALIGWVPSGRVIRRPSQPLPRMPEMAPVGCVRCCRHQLEQPAIHYPHGGVIQKHVCSSHWDGDQALTCMDRSPMPSQGRGLTVVELIIPVAILVERGGILQDVGREGPTLYELLLLLGKPPEARESMCIQDFPFECHNASVEATASTICCLPPE